MEVEVNVEVDAEGEVDVEVEVDVDVEVESKLSSSRPVPSRPAARPPASLRAPFPLNSSCFAPAARTR